MHIVSILTSLTSGGAETLVVNLNREYIAKGHRSTIVTLADAASVGNSAAMEASMRDDVLEHGGAYVPMQLGRRRSAVKGWRVMRELLAKLKPDLLHAHTLRAVPMLWGATGRTPVVATHHNSHLGFSPLMFRLFDQMVSAYVAISKETEAILARHARRPVVHIPNAASKSFAGGKPRASICGAAQILSVGTISAQKHYDLLVDVAVAIRNRSLAKDMPLFRVAGNGIDLEAMRELARSKNVADRVQFMGERTDIAALMKESHLYLNTSRYEGMPITLLEAMASGLPIVATRVPGNTELVEEERNGLLAAQDEPEAIADAIERLIADAALYERCSRGAVEMSGNFSIEATADKHLALFERLGR